MKNNQPMLHSYFLPLKFIVITFLNNNFAVKSTIKYIDGRQKNHKTILILTFTLLLTWEQNILKFSQRVYLENPVFL